jgi:hypothetical protein
MQKILIKIINPRDVKIFLLFFLTGVSFYLFKKINLLFHTRDFQYYISVFASRWGSLFNNNHDLKLHPEGRNILGFFGTDGYPTIRDDIHFSPITYVLSYFYHLGGEILILFIYAFAVSFSLTYLLKRFFYCDSVRGYFQTIFLVVIAIGAARFISFDMRVWVLLVSVIVMLLLFAELKASSIAILSLSLLAFLIREESYFFVLICASYLAYQKRFYLSLLLTALSISYLLVVYKLYFSNTSFNFAFQISSFVFILLPILIFVFTVLTSKFENIKNFFYKFLYLRFPYLKLIYGQDRIFVFWFFILLTPLWANLFISGKVHQLLTHERYFFVWVFLVLLIIRFNFFRRARKPIVFFILGFLMAFPIFRTVSTDRFLLAFNAWQISKSTASGDKVLTSLALHQAFINHNSIVYERLPATSINDNLRFWPSNRDRLIRELKSVDIVVLPTKEPIDFNIFTESGFTCSVSGHLKVCTRLIN